MGKDSQRYLVALGANMRHHRHGSPAHVLRAALAALDGQGMRLAAASPIVTSAPIGPSRRRYANAAAIVDSALAPPALLARLQRIEHAFGRRRRGSRWGPRVLDLDIVLWSGGSWADDRLTIPHPQFRQRRFVLDPALKVAPSWRDPMTGLTLRHLAARLTHPRPVRT